MKVRGGVLASRKDALHYEKQLLTAEERCSIAIESRELAAAEAEFAIRVLREAEKAYVRGCDTREKLAGDYGELRLEVDVALEQVEAALLASNQESIRALTRLKSAEEEVNVAMLALRQAEIDHEQAAARQRRLKQNANHPSLLHKTPAEPTALPSNPPMLDASEISMRDESVCVSPTKIASLDGTMDAEGIAEGRAEETRRRLKLKGVAVEDLFPLSVLEDLERCVDGRGAEMSDGGGGPGQEDERRSKRVGGGREAVKLLGFGTSACCLGASLSGEAVAAPAELLPVLEAFGGSPPVTLACSNHHVLAVSESGEVMAWGDNALGRLGLAAAAAAARSPSKVFLPVPVAGLRGIVVSKVACSDQHSLALTDDGEVLAWGCAAYGVLGIADVSKLAVDAELNLPFSPTPRKVEGLHGPLLRHRVTDISCGRHFNVAASEGGRVFSWGSASLGCLGVGETSALPSSNMNRSRSRWSATPLLLEGLKGQKICRISCGVSHTLALSEGGEVWAWGSAEYGKLGVGDVSSLPADAEGHVFSPIPLHVDELRGMKVMQVSAGSSHSMAVTRQGIVYAWGSAEHGKLGQGMMPEEDSAVVSLRARRWWPFCPSPMEVHSLRGRLVDQVACGEFHSMAATSDGEIFCWGLCRDGSLGVRTQECEGIEHLPAEVQHLPWGHVTIATSSTFTLLLYSQLDNLDLQPWQTPPLLLHLERTLVTKELCDVLLVGSDGEEVEAHAVILLSVPHLEPAIRAAPPAAQEDGRTRIVLKDCDASSLRRALKFVYSGFFEEVDDVKECLALLRTSAQLQILPLTRKCARSLEDKLQPEYVAEVWEAADELELERLRARCLRYIIDHYDECRPEKEPTVKSMMRKHTAFFDLVLSALAPGPGGGRARGRGGKV
uniref:BTB domain-containing protein n=1 Tax=Guillardia theta TaxID=55529 RepID=A0A7S4NPQ6_GUITH|mmetsp:Transcript_28927/g.93245  ORF Transcript_28927/g.93245 Transcript_28927/m.93245 type:complete len:896 (+) Transcript_28927:122-2809(+)